ncbi:MAG TPA: mechanosensitive ion channel domain-containing protein [Polyangiaceae bacterium]|nr:mechanosensitive ion channel domain-containing protein [Polyangiaceae bacterium]
MSSVRPAVFLLSFLLVPALGLAQEPGPEQRPSLNQQPSAAPAGEQGGPAAQARPARSVRPSPASSAIDPAGDSSVAAPVTPIGPPPPPAEGAADPAPSSPARSDVAASPQPALPVEARPVPAAPELLPGPAPSVAVPRMAPVGASVSPSSSASTRAPEAAASGAVSKAALPGAAAVKLGDTLVFSLRTAYAGKSADDRARRAAKALLAALEDPRGNEVRVERQGEVAVIFAGPTPIVQLIEEDARLAGDSSLDVHAGSVASAVRQALESERQRSRVAKNVFSLSLVVFFALIAIYLMKKVGDVADRVRGWLEDHGDRVLTVRVQRIEIVRPAVLKSSALVAVSLARGFGQFGIFYAWLVVVLSLFERTRGYTERLTGFVLTPLSQLMERLATALPLLVVALLAALAVFVLVRFVGLFFAGVTRQETAVAWLPADLAAPTSVLLRVAIVIASLVFAAPIVTGDPDGALGRAGAIALISIGLAATPIVATGLLGSVVLFGRRLRVGQHVEVSGSRGRISAINLMELRIETPTHEEVRIPHLLLLWRPIRGLGLQPRISVEICVAAGILPSRVSAVLERAALCVGSEPIIEIGQVTADGILYRVTVTCAALEGRSKLLSALLEALSEDALPLGRIGGAAARPA